MLKTRDLSGSWKLEAGISVELQHPRGHLKEKRPHWLQSQWMSASRASEEVWDGRPGRRKTLTRAALRARRTRWELPSQTLEASAWWNCSLGMFVLMCSTELPCWGWGGSDENLDDGHPFSGWQNNWHFDQNQSDWSSSGVTGPPLKSQLFRFETACPPFRKFWINELELGDHLSRSFFCMLGVQYLSVCVGRLQGVIQGIFLI